MDVRTRSHPHLYPQAPSLMPQLCHLSPSFGDLNTLTCPFPFCLAHSCSSLVPQFQWVLYILHSVIQCVVNPAVCAGLT